MATAAVLLLVASNFCFAACLLLTAQQVHGALQVDPEDIYKTIKVHVFIVHNWNSVGSVYSWRRGFSQNTEGSVVSVLA